MLIALIGPPSAGKLEVAKYLVVHHNFQPAFLASHRGSNDSADRRAFCRRWDELMPLCHAGYTTSASEATIDRGGTDRDAPLLFKDAEALLDHSTSLWRDNIVTLDLTSREHIDVGFDKRPFFLLIGIDAPTTLRWRRCANRARAEERQAQTLEQFIEADDACLYAVMSRHRPNGMPQLASPAISAPSTPVKSPSGLMRNTSGMLVPEPPSPFEGISSVPMHQVVQPNGLLTSRAPPRTLRELMQASTMIVHNPYASVAALHSHLASLSLASPSRLRPTWDTYFLSLCTLASLRSNCMKRRVGAVLVRSNRVLSTGYNGTPRGLRNCAEGGCARCNGAAAGGTALDECLCLHAEENALLECGRERGGADGTVLYCNTCPCLRCAVKIVQTGVREVVYQLAYSMDDRSRQIFRDANVVFRQYQPM